LKKKNFILSISLAFTKKNKKHFLIPFISILIGTMGLLVILSVIRGFNDYFVESITSFFPHILIEGSPDNSIKEAEKIISVSFKEGVILKNGEFSGIMQLSSDNSGLNNFNEFIIEGKTPQNYDEIAIGKVLSDELNVEKGDTVQIFSIKNNLQPETQNYKISGIFESGMYQYDSSFTLNKGDDLHWTAIYLKNPLKADDYIKNIEGNAVTWTEMNTTFTSAIAVNEFFAIIISLFVLVIAGFGIMNATLFSVLTRKREISILSSLGFTYRQTSLIFVIQSFLISISGIIFGLLIGFLVLAIIQNIQIPLPSDVFYIKYLPIKTHLSDILLTISIEIGISMIFSVLPARRAGKIDPMDVLKSE